MKSFVISVGQFIVRAEFGDYQFSGFQDGDLLIIEAEWIGGSQKAIQSEERNELFSPTE